MKKTLYSVFLLMLTTHVFSQNNQKFSSTENPLPCGQPSALEKMQQEHPERHQAYLQAMQTQTETAPSMEKSGVIYTVPVVFHILHNNGTENISVAQIENALFILNRDFRKQNADVNNVVAQFLPIAADAEIQFEFATIAPNGNCFNGITRTVSSLTNSGDGEAQVNAIVNGNNVFQGIWPHNKYLNVYVCRSLGGAAGYTFLPNGGSAATAENMYYNGVFMLHNYTGAIGTSSAPYSRALTHEVGHWLNLKHTWGDGNTPGSSSNCSMDDGVTDTPNTRGVTSCALGENGCGPLANVENYMDYSYCSKMFTAGQVTRMRNALTSSTGGRSNIWTTTNLQSVGVGISASLCSADFEATQTGLCVGNSTSFSITNTSATINTYAWSFVGGTPATSSAANPTVTYSTPGAHQVSVTITTPSGNRTITKTAYITVATTPTTVPLPITEGFVSATFPPTNWSITNGGGTNTWVRNGSIGTAPTAGNSARINYFNTNAIGEIDDLNTPAFNLSGLSAASLTFDVAYRPYTGQSDKLEVLISTGCGMEYEVIYSKAGTTLQTETANTSGYTAPSTWRNETVNLTPYIGNSQVTIKLRGTNGYGNYIYLDNINISGTTGGGGGPTANFSPSSSTVCVGQTVTYTNNSTGATSWNWNFGAGATPSTATGTGPHSVTYSTAGSKTVSLTVNGGSTSNQSVTVNALPNVSMGGLPTICVNSNPVTLNQGSPAGGTYSGAGVSGNQFTPSSTGTQTITYTYSSGGCTNTATGQIVVDGCLSLTSEDINFNVFPNPTNGNVTIASSLAIDEIIVLDNVGRVVQIVKGEKATEIHLNLEQLATGSYHIQTKFGSTSKITKLIVQ